MTHHTEAERAEFEAWLNPEYSRELDGMDCYIDGAVYSMFSAWKAARRAPAAPVPQGYKIVPVEPTLEMRRAFDSAFTEYLAEDDDEKNDIWLIKKIIEAAPQTPEKDNA